MYRKLTTKRKINVYWFDANALNKLVLFNLYKKNHTKYASQQQSYPRLDFLLVHPQQHGNRPRREDDSANDMNQAIGD